MSIFQGRFFSKFAICLSICWSTIGVLGHQAALGGESRPNVLLILVDDMGYGDLGCYGGRQLETPHIDAIAQGGIRCTQGYVTCPVCAPSRAGLITGRQGNRFGFEHNPSYDDWVDGKWIGLPSDEKTIAEYLQEASYRTGAIGKWHLGNQDHHHPTARGFDHFFGMLNGNHHYFPTLDRHHLIRGRSPIQEIRHPYLTDWFTQEAIEFVVDRTNGPRPWFLYLAYNTPHTPLQAKAEDLQALAHIESKKRRTYLAMQRCLDRNIGKLTRALRETGQDDNTLIVFVNDNGGPCDSNASVNAPLRGQKSTMLEGGIRVPFVMRWPAGLPQGATYEQPISTLDLLPTMLSAAGCPIPAQRQSFTGRGDRGIDGVDLLPFFRGQRDDRPHETLCWRILLRGAAIRNHDWKLLRVPHRSPELYDLSQDVSELNNLATRHPEVVNELLKKLHDWESSLERPPMWMSGNHWMPKNRAHYEREYQITQP